MSKRKTRRSGYWWPRFLAWLIDVIIIGVIANILFLGPSAFGMFSAFGTIGSWIVAFLYWSLTEGYQGRGQSVGKMALNLKLIMSNGRAVDYEHAAISAFGKAFLLPIDMIVGVLARPGQKLRLFNVASSTKVVEIH